MSALVGEMTLVRGRVLLPTIDPNTLAEINPNYRDIINLSREGVAMYDIAYVAQEAWLQNATIRENILFGEPYNRERYEKVLRVCALKPDLRILAAGDMSGIGERGIALSGGQKQRVALARAVYSSRRILLIDDCLSAVDAHTAKHILVECLASNSKLMQGRTRVLVTHHVAMCLPYAQYMVMINVSASAAAFILCGLDWIDAGMAGFILSYALAFSTETVLVVGGYSDNEMSMNSVERIMQYLNIEQEAALETDSENKPPAGWPTRGALQIKDLVVEYVPGAPVLHGISLSVEHGEKVGVVGRTGAGKSTISLALLRFLETKKGQIVLDGVDISKIGLEDLRRNVTIIPQDPVLFNGTIRFNLDPFDEHPDELLWEALRRTHLVREAESQANSSTASIVNTNGTDNKEVISLERMAGIFTSLDAEIKENGSNLSAGQRQLVALARALVRRSKLIIMDEATASVDFDTDRRIQNTIRGPEFANSTLLCIAHRLRTIIDYDRVLVLDNGRVAEFDTPHNLLQKEDGIFRSMCKESGEYAHMKTVADASSSSRAS
ncbi:hypothetical protein IWW48_004283 [Coemansia sp. RSA 1200]|nr:hypothetical protein IWW48_004283 [Coemansia sp. RSA 1200]